MDLPPELRNEVYKCLLCPHVDGSHYRPHEKIRDYKMEPAILSTSKQVCEEASRVLYGYNDIFSIRVDVHTYEPLEKSYPSFIEELPVVKTLNGKIGGVSIVTLDLSMLEEHLPEAVKNKPANKKTRKGRKGKKGKKAEEKSDEGVDRDHSVVFVGLLSALPKVLRFFTLDPYPLDPAVSRLVVHLDNPTVRSSERHRQMLPDLLEYLCEARGFGRAVVLAPPEHSVAAAQTARTMMTRLSSRREATRMADAYERRLSPQLKDGRQKDACATLRNALGFLDLANAVLFAHGGIGGSSKPVPRLEAKLIKTQWAYISCCLSLGRTADVHYLVRQMFTPVSPVVETAAQQKGYWDRVPDAHCALGRAYMGEGALNSAAYSFLQALLLEPAHKGANRAVVCLGKRVARSEDPDHVLARLNVQGVLLKAARQRGATHSELAPHEKEELLRGFRATCGEMESLLLRKRHARGEHVSSYFPIFEHQETLFFFC